MVNFTRAKIEGNLLCQNARFEGVVVFVGITVGSGFHWQGIAGPPRLVVLAQATVETLHDDPESWQGTDYRLNRFHYREIGGRISVRERLAWLSGCREDPLPAPLGPWRLDHSGTEFAPQPWTQLAAVLEADGNRGGAARVRFDREKRLRKAEHLRRLGAIRSVWNLPGVLLAHVGRWFWLLFGLLFGYGHLPQRAILPAALTVVFAAVFYNAAYQAGQMAPNSDVVLTSAEWLDAVACGCEGVAVPGCTMPLRLWEASAAYRDYETFSMWGYGFDLFVPLDALGQEAAWSPSKDRGWLGFVGFYLRWWVQVMGWVIAVIGAAVLTGVVGRKD